MARLRPEEEKIFAGPSYRYDCKWSSILLFESYTPVVEMPTLLVDNLLSGRYKIKYCFVEITLCDVRKGKKLQSVTLAQPYPWGSCSMQQPAILSLAPWPLARHLPALRQLSNSAIRS
jgi:hypothetical protein